VSDAYVAKGKLVKCFEVAGKTEGLDPFENILPRTTRGSSGKQSFSNLSGNLDSITENTGIDDKYRCNDNPSEESFDEMSWEQQF